MSIIKMIISIMLATANLLGLYLLSLTKSNNINKSRTVEIFVIIIIASLLDIINISPILAQICTYILVILLFILFDKINIKKDIINYFLLYIYGFVIELILLVCTMFIFNINPLNLSFFNKQLLSIIFMIIWFSSWNKLTYTTIYNNIIAKLETVITNYVKLEILGIMVLLSVSIIFLNYFYKEINIKVVIAFVIVIIIIIILLIIFLKSILHRKKLETNNEALENLLKEYEKIVEDYRMIRHNLISDFLVIRSKANKECAEIIDYKLMNYNKDYQWINEMSKLPKGLQGLIYAKHAYAKTKKTKIFIKSKSSLDKINIDLNNKIYNDLYKALSLIIDNAIDGASLSKEKVVIIDVNIKNNLIKILVGNCFRNSINLEKIGKKGYSTKGNNHGLGLNYIKYSISKEIVIKNKIINDVFTTEIFLNIKKELKRS